MNKQQQQKRRQQSTTDNVLNKAWSDVVYEINMIIRRKEITLH